MSRLDKHWERAAARWIAWARAPGFDSYWRYRDAFFALVPPPGAATLEVGCGEGRVARDLSARRHRVTAIDASPSLLAAARAADPGGDYRLARAEALPFEAGSFDLVVAYNVLMDVDDLPAVVGEIARVLAPAGRLCACVTHPINDAGAFRDESPDAPFTISGSYLESRPFAEPVRRGGLEMTFHGRTHSLEDYAQALKAAGLLIEAIREPVLDPDVARPDELRWRRIPMFLMLRARPG
jgi:SAM-dependent methyltransferase